MTSQTYTSRLGKLCGKIARHSSGIPPGTSPENVTRSTWPVLIVWMEDENSGALLTSNSARIRLKIIKTLTANQRIGAVAQLGARLHGMQEVTGSIPVSSTFKAMA